MDPAEPIPEQIRDALVGVYCTAAAQLGDEMRAGLVDAAHRGQLSGWTGRIASDPRHLGADLEIVATLVGAGLMLDDTSWEAAAEWIRSQWQVSDT